jgi:hypothetical protein
LIVAKARRLKPFSIAGVLSHCPECGATGDYDLLKKKAQSVIAAWDACSGIPDTSTDRSRLDSTIGQMREVIDMMRG